MLAILASNCAHGYSSEACAGVSAAYLLLTPTIPQACALPLQASWHSPWPYFALACILVAAGFYPTFYAVLPALDIARLLHGSAATAWMLLPLLQYWLVRSGARRLHRLVGYTSLALAACVVITGLRVVQTMVRRNVEDFQIRRIKFVWLDLSGLMLFCLGLAIASARKRNIALQVRLLACTVLIPLEAALERLLMNAFPALVPNLHVALYAALFSMEAIRVALIVANGVRARALATACAAHLLRSHARHGYAECRASCFSAVLYVVRAPEFLGARNGRESRCLPALFF